MKKKNLSLFWKVCIAVAVFVFFFNWVNIFPPKRMKIPFHSGKGVILALDLKGPIFEKNKFMKDLRKYSNEEEVKGVLIHLDSPGGVVSMSQEIYHEFNKIKQVLNKPVVISVGSMMASGALYASAGASIIFVNAGSLVGSIGVIFPMINMSGLYEWAKLDPYVIKTGQFKDAGSPTRPITPAERVLFQDLANEFLEQFKLALMKGRDLSAEELEPYTDARVFTGETAVSVGLADSVGTYSDAIERIGELCGLGKNPNLFTPQPSYFEILNEKFSSSLSRWFRGETLYRVSKFIDPVILSLRFSVQPLYIFPPAIGM